MKNPQEIDKPIQPSDRKIESRGNQDKKKSGQHDSPGIRPTEKPATEWSGQESGKRKYPN
jgi:hypothetical protein